MDIYLQRFSGEKEDTLGLLFDNNCQFMCFVLEDQYQNEKVYGETRIPAGRYKVLLRTEGGFHKRYSEKFGEDHKGMLHLQDVPGFNYVLIHIGNDDDDTAGCLLVGDQVKSNIPYDKGFIGDSTQAYKRIYPKLAEAAAGYDLWINISDEGELELNKK